MIKCRIASFFRFELHQKLITWDSRWSNRISKKQNYLLLTVKTTAVKQLTKHPTKIVLDLLCIHSVCTLLSSNYCQPLISDAHKDLSHPPHFCITGGKHNSDRQICKDITVNDAPAFWLQATAIKVPLITNSVLLYTHTMLRNSLR